jgi:hypothetical protein
MLQVLVHHLYCFSSITFTSFLFTTPIDHLFFLLQTHRDTHKQQTSLGHLLLRLHLFDICTAARGLVRGRVLLLLPLQPPGGVSALRRAHSDLQPGLAAPACGHASQSKVNRCQLFAKALARYTCSRPDLQPRSGLRYGLGSQSTP